MRKKSIRANKETKKQEKSLESRIRDAACPIRGAKDAPKYKDYILHLTFTKRLCLDDAEADIIGKSGGLLIKCEIEKERGFSNPRKGKEGGWKTPAPLKPFGQEYIADNKEFSITRSSAVDYLTFVAAQGEGGVEVVYADEDIWLTQKMMGVLHDVKTHTINYHLKKVFDDNEFVEDSVVRKFRITAADGKNYNTGHISGKPWYAC